MVRYSVPSSVLMAQNWGVNNLPEICAAIEKVLKTLEKLADRKEAHENHKEK